MAASQLTGATERADHPTASDVVRAVTRYENAAARYDELIARPASALTPREVDAIGEAQQVLAESFGILAAAGQHHLVRGI